MHLAPRRSQRGSHHSPDRLLARVTLAALLLAGAAAASEHELVLDPAASRVAFTLDSTWHTVRGELTVKSGVITFDLDSGRADGTVVLDAASAVTGNKSRDKTMHQEVLESARFPEIVFRAASIAAAIDAGGSGPVTLNGRVAIHGAEHAVTLDAKVGRAGDRVTADGSLAVPFVEWGMKDPSFILARVAKVVQVRFTAVGMLRAVARSVESPSSSPE